MTDQLKPYFLLLTIYTCCIFQLHWVKCQQSFGELDIGHRLNNGVRSGPGIKVKFNQRTFQYLSFLAGDLIAQEIPKLQIPPSRQRIPQLQGSVTISDLRITYCRRPRNVIIYPRPPNRIVLAVQGVDVGVTGRLSGQFVILIPIPLYGRIFASLSGVSVMTEIALEASPYGQLVAKCVNCRAVIRRLNIHIANAGLVGTIANANFKNQIIQRSKPLIERQICQQAAKFINQDLNQRLAMVPTSFPLATALQFLENSGTFNALPFMNPLQQLAALTINNEQDNSQHIGQSKHQHLPKSHQPFATKQRAIRGRRTKRQLLYSYLGIPPNYYIFGQQDKRPSTYYQSPDQHGMVLYNSQSQQRTGHRAFGNPQFRPVHPHFHQQSRMAVLSQPTSVTREDIFTRRTKVLTNKGSPDDHTVADDKELSSLVDTFSGIDEGDGGPGILDGIADGLDLRQLIAPKAMEIMQAIKDLYLSFALTEHPMATNTYLITCHSGEISPNGEGGTPFGPHPMDFPLGGQKMVEILVSDFVPNSLLYHLHRKGVLSFTVSKDTPGLGKVADLLRVTCGEQDEGGLGLCIGDFVPALLKYDDAVLNIRTGRAPSILLSSRQGGHITADLVALIDIVGRSKTMPAKTLGTLKLSAILEALPRFERNRLFGNATMATLDLVEEGSQLKLPQATFNVLTNIMRQAAQEYLNTALSEGIPIQLPQNIYGIGIVDPMVRIYDRFVHLSSDITIDQTFINLISANGCSPAPQCYTGKGLKLIASA